MTHLDSANLPSRVGVDKNATHETSLALDCSIAAAWRTVNCQKIGQSPKDRRGEEEIPAAGEQEDTRPFEAYLLAGPGARLCDERVEPAHLLLGEAGSAALADDEGFLAPPQLATEEHGGTEGTLETCEEIV